ncbi:hypothetical protein D3C80_386600 [compost metagenome]
MPDRVEEQGLGHIVIVIDVDVVDTRTQGGLDDRNGAAVEGSHGVEDQVDAIEQGVQPCRITDIGAYGARPGAKRGGQFLGGFEVEVADDALDLGVTGQQLARDVRADVAAAQ